MTASKLAINHFVNRVCLRCDAEVKSKAKFRRQILFRNNPSSISVFRLACHTRRMARGKYGNLHKEICGTESGSPGPVATMSMCFA